LELINFYKMELATKCHFYMSTYLYYKDRADFSSFDGEYHDPKGAERSLSITHP
jgi:hypothetical protein